MRLIGAAWRLYSHVDSTLTRLQKSYPDFLVRARFSSALIWHGPIVSTSLADLLCGSAR